MKVNFIFLLTAAVFFTACSHTPSNIELQNEKSDSSTAFVPANLYNSIDLSESLAYSTKHYFSDTLLQDSFVIEMPAGNIISPTASKVPSA